MNPRKKCVAAGCEKPGVWHGKDRMFCDEHHDALESFKPVRLNQWRVSIRETLMSRAQVRCWRIRRWAGYPIKTYTADDIREEIRKMMTPEQRDEFDRAVAEREAGDGS